MASTVLHICTYVYTLVSGVTTFICKLPVYDNWAGFACGHHPAMAAIHLFSILPPIKPTNQTEIRLFGFRNWF